MLIRSDARHIPLADGCVQCCITSPPYWGLRKYSGEQEGVWGGADGCVHEFVDAAVRSSYGDPSGKSTLEGGKSVGANGASAGSSATCQRCGAWRGAYGLEPTIDLYAQHTVEIFREVRRVLRSDGVCFINIGDSYYSSPAKGGSGTYNGRNGYGEGYDRSGRADGELKPKDLCMIPARVALALQAPYEHPCCVKDHKDRAWLAAMFDAEGTIGIRRYDSYREGQVYQDGFVAYTSVTNNDVELLDHCIALTGYGSSKLKCRAGTSDKRGVYSRRDSYGWRLDGNDAVDVIRAIYPYLIVKKKQAVIAYTLDQLNKAGRAARGNGRVPEELQAKRAKLWELVKLCNQRQTVDLPGWLEEPKPRYEPGWYVRSDIIWEKFNPMPESVGDRPSDAYEHILMLTKSANCFYDYIAAQEDAADGMGGKRNGRNVWRFSTQPTPLAHFATFPEELVIRCIQAATSERGCCAVCGAPWERVVERSVRFESGSGKAGNKPAGKWNGTAQTESGDYDIRMGPVVDTQTKGWRPACPHTAPTVPCIVYDPFAGSGTVGLVAFSMGRRFILSDLAYQDLQRQRLPSMALVPGILTPQETK